MESYSHKTNEEIYSFEGIVASDYLDGDYSKGIERIILDENNEKVICVDFNNKRTAFVLPVKCTLTVERELTERVANLKKLGIPKSFFKNSFVSNTYLNMDFRDGTKKKKLVASDLESNLKEAARKSYEDQLNKIIKLCAK